MRCPGCYAYGEDHLGGAGVLRDLSDFKGKELVDGVIRLADEYRPLHISLVGGEPLVRFRELNEILPKLAERQIHIQVVTSAVRPIPPEWRDIPRMTLVVSIDGLAPEHDERRKPATYERILKNIEGHRITVHCTVTSQMTRTDGYLHEFMRFWSARPEVEKIWTSLFTPQVGETSVEILTSDDRARVIQELRDLGGIFPKLRMPKGMLDVYAKPPGSPDKCTFSLTTRSFTADLETRVTPCQFGGNPDCSQCGCIASAGLEAIARHRLKGRIRVGAIFEWSLKIGSYFRKDAESRRKPRLPEKALTQSMLRKSKAGGAP